MKLQLLLIAVAVVSVVTSLIIGGTMIFRGDTIKRLLMTVNVLVTSVILGLIMARMIMPP